MADQPRRQFVPCPFSALSIHKCLHVFRMICTNAEVTTAVLDPPQLYLDDPKLRKAHKASVRDHIHNKHVDLLRMDGANGVQFLPCVPAFYHMALQRGLPSSLKKQRRSLQVSADCILFCCFIQLLATCSGQQ